MAPIGPRLRVVSYNLHGLRDDQPALRSLLRGLDPDVLILQEAPRRFRWRQRCAALARGLDLVVGTGGLPALGNLILTSLRVAVKETWSVRFPLTPGRHLRGVAMARCLVAGSPLLVAGSHLSLDPAERADQAQRLIATVTEQAGPQESVVLGVDVNDVPGSPAWTTLTGALSDPAAGAVSADPAASTGPAAGGASADPADPAGVAGSLASYPASDPRRRIDAIFTGGPARVAAVEVVDSPLARRASDHLPVLTELELPA